MAYTPELSFENSYVLKRIAWWLGKPKKRIIDFLFFITCHVAGYMLY